MSLFKAWSEYKLKKKFVVTENLQNLFPKVSDSILFSLEGGDLTLFEALTDGAYDRLNWQHSGEFDQIFQKRQMPGGLPGGDGRLWN